MNCLIVTQLIKKKIMKSSFLLGIAALLTASSVNAQMDTTGTNGKIGKMSLTAFNNINTKGNQTVSAIKPTSTPLSSADQQLLTKIATGGMRQLAVSQAVVDKVTNPKVKLLAQSEVEEQTGISAKLKEIATTKNATIPAEPDAAAQQLVAQIQNLSGDALDAFYLDQSGIKGHELLQQTMTTVSSTAKDATLKQLAVGTLPVIRTHLTVSREEKAMMKGKTGANKSMKK